MEKFLIGLILFASTLACAQTSIWTRPPAYPQNIIAGTVTASSLISPQLFQGPPVSPSGASYTQLTGDNFIISASAAGQTITLLAPASYPGKTTWVKNTTAFAVISASANVVPLAGGAAAAAILAAGPGKFAMLVSDGTNWIVMAAN